MTCSALRNFLTTLDATPLHARRDLIRSAILQGNGNWNLPPLGAGVMPALIEIQLYDIWASGLSLEEAIDSWIKLARKYYEPEAA